jgi:hypothetical protein
MTFFQLIPKLCQEFTTFTIQSVESNASCLFGGHVIGLQHCLTNAEVKLDGSDLVLTNARK